MDQPCVEDGGEGAIGLLPELNDDLAAIAMQMGGSVDPSSLTIVGQIWEPSEGFEIQNELESIYNRNPWQGFEHTVDDRNQAKGHLEKAIATDEHGFNNVTDLGVSDTHSPNPRSGDAYLVALSQPGNAHSVKNGKEELYHFREHSLNNHKSSQRPSCTTLPKPIGEEDEMISISGANIDREKLESNPRVPSVGMQFPSVDAVCDFYKNYAEQTGFCVRKGKVERSKKNDDIKAKYFLCSLAGQKSQDQINKLTKYKKRDKRTGCDAKIKCRENHGMWMISQVVLEHNHSLERCLPGAQGMAEDLHGTTTLSTGKIADEVRMAREGFLISDVDCSDFSCNSGKNRPVREPDDTQCLSNYFKKIKAQDPFFFCMEDAATGNFFWRDSRSKVDYAHFSDVLVLDTRTRIEKNGIICAAFWGLNNHRQRVIFGWAFLIDQTAASFSWLLDSFLEAMSWRKPLTIITEVCFSKEIAGALMKFLQESRHCLAVWSILNDFSGYVSPLSDEHGVPKDFSECVQVHSQEEFESKWNSLLRKYNLQENARLASLYAMREKWSPAFMKDVFSAGLFSMQNEEDARLVLENICCETMTLSQIAHRCGEVAKQMRNKEIKEDRCCKKNTMNLKSTSPLEKEAERLYTRPIFKMFQDEFINGLSLAIKEGEGTATHQVFKLTKAGTEKEETVTFNHSSYNFLECSCRKFETEGILCVHALKVLNSKNIFNIPSCYLLKRWTKSAKDSLPKDAPGTRTTCDEGPIDPFISEFMEKALHFACRCDTKKRKRRALEYINSALEYIFN